jgi:hypothetical protein
VLAFAPSLARQLLSCSGVRGRHRCTTTRLVCNQLVLTPVAVLLAGLTLRGNVLCRASVAIPLMGLALHQHSLRLSSLMWLGVHVELLV